MIKKMFLSGTALIAVVVLVYQCTKIDYNNPIDINGTNADYLRTHPEALLDTNNNLIADLLEDPLYNRDTTKPVITLLRGDTAYIQLDDTINELQTFYLVPSKAIKVTDAGGGPINFSTPQHNVNIYKVNNTPYTITYTVQDTSGNTTSKVRYVYIVEAPQVDNTPPIITVSEDTMYVTQGNEFSDPGVGAFDTKDGDLRDKVVVNGTVDVNTPGTYTLTYTVSDNAGNDTSAIRIVIVIKAGSGTDNVPPVITLKGADTLLIPVDMSVLDYESTIYQEPGFTATDNVDGDISAKVQVSEMKQLSQKYWYKNYTVTDAAGNSASPKRRYFDTQKTGGGTAPVIDLVFPDSVIQIIIGNQWKEPGYSAVDIDEGDITSQVIVIDTNVTNNIDTEGNYQVIYSVTNKAGLTTQKTRFVSVIESKYDHKAPVITLKGKNPDTVLVKSSTSYKEPGYTAIDNRDGDVTAKVTVSGTVDMTRLKDYKISYSVTDEATNRETVYRTVWVVPDTENTDLLVRYIVPSPDTLKAVKGTYTTFNTDGAGPDLRESTITSIKFEWTPPAQYSQAQLQFQIQYSGQPYNKDFNTEAIKTALSKPGAKMTLSGTTVTGLDGTYYVTVQGTTLVWVKIDGSFAILLTR